MPRHIAPQSVDRWPSGERQQTVNLPGFPYAGSNPALSTNFIFANVREKL